MTWFGSAEGTSEAMRRRKSRSEGATASPRRISEASGIARGAGYPSHRTLCFTAHFDNNFAATIHAHILMGNAGSIITEAKARGNTFFQDKKYRSAVQHYRHALATESGGAEAHRSVGRRRDERGGEGAAVDREQLKAVASVVAEGTCRRPRGFGGGEACDS